MTVTLHLFEAQKRLRGPEFAFYKPVRQCFKQKYTSLNHGIPIQIKYGVFTEWADKECVWEVDKDLFHRRRSYNSMFHEF